MNLDLVLAAPKSFAHDAILSKTNLTFGPDSHHRHIPLLNVTREQCLEFQLENNVVKALVVGALSDSERRMAFRTTPPNSFERRPRICIPFGVLVIHRLEESGTDLLRRMGFVLDPASKYGFLILT